MDACRTVVHNVLVGSVSFASPGAKALHNASTAQEITVISQGAANFEFRVSFMSTLLFAIRAIRSNGACSSFLQRWHDPSPMPPSPTLAPTKLPPSPSTSSASSSWSSPSPPMVQATVPTSNLRSENGPAPLTPISPSQPPQTDEEEFEPERSPSPITGRPRPRRRLNRINVNAVSNPNGNSNNYVQNQTAPYSPAPTHSSGHGSNYQRSPSSSSPPRRLSNSPPPPSSPADRYTSAYPPRGSSESMSPPPSRVPGGSPSPVPESSVYERASYSSGGNGVIGRQRSYSQSTTTTNGAATPGPRGNGHQQAQRGYRRDQNGSNGSSVGGGQPGASDSEMRGSSLASPVSVSSSSPSHRHQNQHQQGRAAQPSGGPSATTVITFDHLPNKSFRTAFILDRFSLNCTILYCSNDLLVESTHAIGRSFFDFVAPKDEGIVKSWIECVKGWGVNERGQPSDGGFGFGRFVLLVGGRESLWVFSLFIAQVSRIDDTSHHL